MESTTDELQVIGGGTRRSVGVRFAGAFLLGGMLALLAAAGGLALFQAHYADRVLPGVRVGTVELAGLTAPEAMERLRSAYVSLGEGRLVLEASSGTVETTFAELGRSIDAAPLVEQALAAGRAGDPLRALLAEARLVVRGTTIEPRLTWDRTALEQRIAALDRATQRPPVDASVVSSPTGFVPTRPADGSAIDTTAALDAATRILDGLDAPPLARVAVVLVRIPPTVDERQANRAAGRANLMAGDLELALGPDRWTIPASTVAGWIRFGSASDGTFAPIPDPARIAAGLASVEKLVERPARDATFLTGKAGDVVGVKEGVDGRRLETAATSEAIASALLARGTPGSPPAAVTPVVAAVPPSVTTDEATKVAPRMTLISSWTTYYPIGIKNGYGANIEVPTRLIDGTVVAPGATFDFWTVVGEVSTAKGYKQGGAIINGHTEPQGALAGGICSCSTTLFNAALRAGLAMGPRMNHYYYIDRYPLGLDATVWISSSGSRQSMSWRNDTAYPILVHGSIRHDGPRGYVTFELWSVPTGRTVAFTTPIVKNLTRATTTTQKTDTIPAGTREQVEWPADGKDVWVTRTVTDASGTVIHTETYYSHYARVDGLILVGVPGSNASSPTGGP